MDLTAKLTGVIVSIAGKLRADEDVPKSESVSVVLDIDFGQCSLNDVLQYAAADRKIAWANGTGRKSCGSLKPGQHIKVLAGAPNKVYVDPMTAMRERVKACATQAEKDALIAELTRE